MNFAKQKRFYFTALFALTLVIAKTYADEDVEAGKKVFKKIGCASCHQPDGMGKAVNGVVAKQQGPQIAGLDPVYAATQIKAIRGKTRVTEFTVDMNRKVSVLTDEEIEHVAKYISTLAPRHKGMHEK